MSMCKTCLKDSKEHSKKLWQMHLIAQNCMLCHKDSDSIVKSCGRCTSQQYKRLLEGKKFVK